MVYFCYALFLIGLGFYVAALFFFGTDTGQDLFYLGTGILLVNTVLLLLRVNQLIAERRSTKPFTLIARKRSAPPARSGMPKEWPRSANTGARENWPSTPIPK